MSTELCQIDRNSFDKKSPVQLTGDVASQIRVLPGYQTEIAFKKFQGVPRLVVNVDTMSKVLSQFSVLSIIQQEVGHGNSTKVTNTSHKSQIKMKLVGNVVYTSYVFNLMLFLNSPTSSFRYNNTPYTVESVEFGMSPHDHFGMRKRGVKDEEDSISY